VWCVAQMRVRDRNARFHSAHSRMSCLRASCEMSATRSGAVIHLIVAARVAALGVGDVTGTCAFGDGPR